jgi:hypothetical protein
MQGPRRSGPSPIPPGDASRAWRPSLGYLAAALVVFAAGPVYWLMSSPSPTRVADTTAKPTALPQATTGIGAAAKAPDAALAGIPVAAAPVRIANMAAPAVALPAASPQVSRTRDPNGDLTPDLSDYVNAGERPTMAEVIARLHAAGVTSGLGAFSPPGTRPPLVGLAVPEDFVLPEGYVRHHQATDDGQRIEAILRFSPDFKWVDAAGQALALPEDRVVPPELAPPGLPIRRIVIPAPIEPGK